MVAATLPPPCPEWLPDAARAEYDRIGGLLVAAGVMMESDGPALAMVAVSYATWVEAERAIVEHGLLVKGRDGAPAINPFRKVANEAHDRIARLLMQFGMTPISRGRVKGRSDGGGEVVAEPLDEWAWLAEGLEERSDG